MAELVDVRAFCMLMVLLLVLDGVFDHFGVTLACWALLREFAATVHRGIWASS